MSMSPDDETPPEEPSETPPEPEEKQAEAEETAEPEAQEETTDPEGDAPEGEETPEGEEAKEGEDEDDAGADAADAGTRRRRGGSGWQRQRIKMERLERQNQLLVEQLSANRPPPAPEPAPKEQTTEEKSAAYIRNLLKQELAQQAEEQRQRTVISAFQRRTAEVRATKEDFDDVVLTANLPTASPLAQVLLTSEHGPDIMYELAKSPAELARLSALPPLDAAREVGRLEAKLAARTQPAKTNGTTAKRPPAPPTTVKGSTSNTRSLDTLNMSQYKSAYRAGRR